MLVFCIFLYYREGIAQSSELLNVPETSCFKGCTGIFVNSCQKSKVFRLKISALFESLIA